MIYFYSSSEQEQQKHSQSFIKSWIEELLEYWEPFWSGWNITSCSTGIFTFLNLVTSVQLSNSWNDQIVLYCANIFTHTNHLDLLFSVKIVHGQINCRVYTVYEFYMDRSLDVLYWVNRVRGLSEFWVWCMSDVHWGHMALSPVDRCLQTDEEQEYNTPLIHSWRVTDLPCKPLTCPP